MVEIRKDYLLNRWVIISEKRKFRPKPKNKTKKKKLPKKSKDCPFCPGNEDMCPEALVEKPSDKKWKIRVIGNKYPAVTKEKELRESYGKLTTKKTGYGSHYLMIDTPTHNSHPALYKKKDWKLWFETVKDVFNQEAADENIQYVLVFKNRGIEAGASQPHPHTQIISLPTVPHLINEEMSAADDYYTFNGKCIFCEIIKMESKYKKRVVFENNHVIAFCPYAPLWPFEVWIFPKEHSPSIQMSKESEEGLLNALSKVLKTYYKVLDDPPFNFYLHTAYLRMKDHVPQKYHFHIEINPRLEKDAGFELGAGMNITTISPEDAAEILRKKLK
jgi:UDPglucose--hexose-1-phosphate uridylyltransferase